MPNNPLNQKISVNFDKILKISVISSIILLIFSLLFKVKTLIVAGQLILFVSIIGMIFSIVYSLLNKAQENIDSIKANKNTGTK
jgi:uncharacterized membrane protein